MGIVPPREKIVDGFLQRIVFSQRANLLRNNPEKNNYSRSKATPDPIIRSYSLYHGLIVHLPEHRARFNRKPGPAQSIASTPFDLKMLRMRVEYS